MSELPVGWVLVFLAAGIFVFWLTKSEEGRRFRERVKRIVGKLKGRPAEIKEDFKDVRMTSKRSAVDRILVAPKRTSVELGLFFFVPLFLFVVPLDFESQGLQLLLYKVLVFSRSQLHAMVVRKWFFPYIDFSYDISPHRKYMVIAPHMGAAYVYSQGG